MNPYSDLPDGWDLSRLTRGEAAYLTRFALEVLPPDATIYHVRYGSTTYSYASTTKTLLSLGY